MGEYNLKILNGTTLCARTMAQPKVKKRENALNALFLLHVLAVIATTDSLIKPLDHGTCLGSHCGLKAFLAVFHCDPFSPLRVKPCLLDGVCRISWVN